MIRNAEILRRGRMFRLPALFVLGWLNLVAQPCLAENVDMPPGMSHCDHGGTAKHPAPCSGMQASNCFVADGVAVDSARAAPSHFGNLSAVPLSWIHDIAPGEVAGAPSLHATGPPLHLLFGRLRN